MNGEQIAVPHRRQHRITPPCRQPVHSHSARTDDRFRIGSQHRFRTDMRRHHRQPGEHIAPAAQPDHFIDDMFAIQGEQRNIGHLIKHADRRPVTIPFLQDFQLCQPPLRNLPGRRFPARKHPQPDHIVRNIRQMLRTTVKNRNPRLPEFLDLWRKASATPGHQQIRLQRQHPFHIDLPEISHHRQGACLFRIIAVRSHRHQTIARPDGIHHLRDMRRKRYDTLRRLRQRHGMTLVIGHTDRSRHLRHPPQETYPCHHLAHHLPHTLSVRTS